jgi:hypothetical protein
MLNVCTLIQTADKSIIGMLSSLARGAFKSLFTVA